MDRHHEQNELKQHLQRATASQVERLAASLIARLLGIPIAVAKPGFQHGADAGTAGRNGRQLRIECKKYRDTTSLDERELLGEIDQALARDEALEAWVLVTTRPVPEQLVHSLDQKAERIGVPVVVVDWLDRPIPRFAALCAVGPELVAKEISSEAGKLARSLQSTSRATVETLRRELQAWCIGFLSVRSRSHQKLMEVWNSPREAIATLGYNAAGGAQQRRIRRMTVYEALSGWWRDSPIDVPAAVVGLDGVGKTWATLDWLTDVKDRLPIVLTIPSLTAVTTVESATGIKELIADELHGMTGVRNRQYWLGRVDRFLSRPPDQGPAVAIFFDGLNQNSSVVWDRTIQILQGTQFADRIRVIVSCRSDYFENRLHNLNRLFASSVRINVDRYDSAVGGELDRLLVLHGVKKTELYPEVIQLAKSPRLFELVIRFRNELVDAAEVTVHRLLWEYGRESFGALSQRSFSVDEWHEWLREISARWRDGTRVLSRKALSETVRQPYLNENEVYDRLSDIIDGGMVANVSGELVIDRTLVNHALGAALLAYLDGTNVVSFSDRHAKLVEWLDPISGFDQRSEILRAAVSILVAQKSPNRSIAGVLVTAWLQSQNIPDHHREELVALAPSLLNALLDAIEHSEGRVYGAARLWASYALRSIPRNSETAIVTILGRSCRWLRTVSRQVDPRRVRDDEFEKRRSVRFIERIGRDSSGSLMVAGCKLDLVNHSDNTIARIVPSIIEGFPIARALPVLANAAAALAVADTSPAWGGLRWICLLNEVDPDETAEALRRLSHEVRQRIPEPGLHPDLPSRISALLLWLTGQAEDDRVAASIDPQFDRSWSYRTDYLSHPETSFFPLERRHAPLILRATDLSVPHRVQRLGDLWFDPHLRPAQTFVSEIGQHTERIDVTKLTRRPVRAIDDIEFERIEPALARCNPSALASLLRAKLRGMKDSPIDARYWLALHCTDYMLLTHRAEAEAARVLRLRSSELDEYDKPVVCWNLLLSEIANFDVHRQFVSIIQAELDFVPIEFQYIVRRPDATDIEILVRKYREGSKEQQHLLLVLLSLHPVDLNEESWDWVHEIAHSAARTETKISAFGILSASDPVKFGRALVARGWSWSVTEDIFVNHYGTSALIEATDDTPFEEIASRLAPWRLLESARRRGCNPAELDLAIELFGRVLTDSTLDLLDPGIDLSVDRSLREDLPFAYSVAPRPTQSGEGLPWIGNPEEQLRAHRGAIATAERHAKTAWRSGASLYLVDLHMEDLRAVLAHAPDVVDRWLVGWSEPTRDFIRRVRLAEGTFLGLCEALMEHDPPRGTKLWCTLRRTLATTYVGGGGVDDLLHMAFRVPDSPEVSNLRCELLGFGFCHNDRMLFDIALAATYNGRSDWLKNTISSDRASSTTWRNKRAEVLAGFTIDNRLPVEGAWSDGEIETDAAELLQRAARSRWTEACARYWWEVFLQSPDRDRAYAAWVLFLRSADRRSSIWTKQTSLEESEMSDLLRLKIAHHRINHRAMQRALTKRDEKLEKSYLGRSIVAGVGPWASEL